jgi:hypothetical protein
MLIEAEGEGRRNGRWKVESCRVRGRHCLYCSRLHMQKAFPRLHACNVVSLVESFAAQRRQMGGKGYEGTRVRFCLYSCMQL